MSAFAFAIYYNSPAAEADHCTCNCSQRTDFVIVRLIRWSKDASQRSKNRGKLPLMSKTSEFQIFVVKILILSIVPNYLDF